MISPQGEEAIRRPYFNVKPEFRARATQVFDSRMLTSDPSPGAFGTKPIGTGKTRRRDPHHPAPAESQQKPSDFVLKTPDNDFNTH
jgi:hypothetical protein